MIAAGLLPVPGDEPSGEDDEVRADAFPADMRGNVSDVPPQIVAGVAPPFDATCAAESSNGEPAEASPGSVPLRAYIVFKPPTNDIVRMTITPWQWLV